MGILRVIGGLAVAGLMTAGAWTPHPIIDDPLVRMPGTQSGEVQLEGPSSCVACHGVTQQDHGPGFAWKGTMMSQSARDFLFWGAMTVAAQDSIWALGTPNAVDLCERCHFPEGWMEGRSDPANASAMAGSDFDGVHCDICHTMYDPFFEETHAGTREGNDWAGYWDEADGGLSEDAAQTTYEADVLRSLNTYLFNGQHFYADDNLPLSDDYRENGGGQMYLTGGVSKRGSFADANALHAWEYSRYHKSKFFCGTCHDVSNAALANLDFANTTPGDGETELPSEVQSPSSYFHVERTFSEFMLSAYAQDGGTPGVGPFAPEVFDTSLPGDYVGRCQDCHMRDTTGTGANVGNPVSRPDGSTEHPHSGQPSHMMAGGNMFVPYVLASAMPGSANHDATNAGLLGQGAETLTLDLSSGIDPDPAALLAYVDEAEKMLQDAAAIETPAYNEETGALSFRVRNQTGHKLISGYPEGRRMFINVKVYDGAALVHEINPYDTAVGTLRGLDDDYSPNSPALAAHEVYDDALVYEMHPTSDLTGEQTTFHFVLATGRYKDNRIPPKGFDIAAAPDRLCQPVWQGADAPEYFTAAEYAGGYDDVSLTVPAGATKVEVRLFYQTTSREYVEFLRDQINGDADTLSSPTPSGEANAYVVQSDPFFSQLRAWGDTVWDLWENNKNVPGAAPVLMTQATVTLAAPPPTGCSGNGTPWHVADGTILAVSALVLLAVSRRNRMTAVSPS